MEIDTAELPAIDLESLVFNDGGHTMTNKKCVVPEKSFKRSKPGYEEIHIPAPEPRPLEAGEKLIKVASLPQWTHPAFNEIESLNRVQSRVFPKAFGSDQNLLMCAPTGAGKTNVALLSMLHEIGKHLQEDGSVNVEAFKIVYIAPMKALVQEMVTSFGRRLQPFGIHVAELTGDQTLTRQQLAETQVIVTTPEKWDVVTRKGTEQAHVRLVRLVIIDEIHLLHDDRGPVLEALVARLLRQCEETQELVRLVGLSATLPNYGDVARFLRVRSDGVFFFDSTYRPCPLAQQFIGVTEKNALKRMAMMNEIVAEKVVERAGQSQLIVFVHSRKDTVKTAKAVRDSLIAQGKVHQLTGSGSRTVLESAQVKSPELKELLPYGFAVHHAGMTRPDRNAVEDLFAAGHIQVLVSTATLAWGVNLPAHTVIIKGTQVYSPERGKWAPLSAQDTLQMLGRAGRPQYDVQGEGIIITQHGDLQFYLSLLNQQLPIESQLMTKLLDHVNAEVVLGSIYNFGSAVDWIGYTYLAVRMARDPEAYGLGTFDQQARRKALIHSALTTLDKSGLVRYDRRTGLVQSTELGRISAHYYVTHQSMATYNEHLRPWMDDLDLLRVFSLSSEFKLIPVRHEEKIELTRLAERVPIPIKDGPEEPVAKINVLLQSYISKLALEGFALASDMVYVTQSASRILRALFELCLRRGWARLAKKALNLCKMVDRRQWLSMTPLRQIHNQALDPVVLRKLENKDFPFDRLFDLNPQELGELVRVPKLGKAIFDQLRLFPRVSLAVQTAPLARDLIRLDLTIQANFEWDLSVHNPAETFWIIVEDVDEEHVLHVEPFILKKKWAEEEHYTSITVPLLDPLPPAYFVTLVSDRWMQSEARAPVMLMNLVLPEKPAATVEVSEEAIDLKSELEGVPGLFEKLSIADLTAVESTVFPAAWKSDENMIVAAPESSKLTPLLTIARSLAMNPAAKCVFISPKIDQSLLETSTSVLSDLLPSNKGIEALTGDSPVDLKILERSAVVFATPSQWEQLSRRWKTRKNVLAVGLLIVDGLQWMAQDPAIEVVLSRTRFMSAHLESSQSRKIRIVSLSCPIGPIRDLAGWLGVPLAACFNFDTDVRSNRFAIQIQGFNGNSPSLKSTYRMIAGRKAIVVVSSQREAIETANVIRALKTADAIRLNQPINEDSVAVYDGSSTADHLILVRGQEVPEGLSAEVVVIQGTQSYLGKEHRYVDYPIAEILQILNMSSGSVLICCPSHRKTTLKRLLSSPIPLESRLDHRLADLMNAEIAVGTIRSKQDAVDWLTWSFLYRRLAQNPNFYGQAERSARHLSEHLSQLIEQSCDELATAKCIEVEDMSITPLNLGIIAAYYGLDYLTIEMMAMSLQPSTKLRGILEIVAAANEFGSLEMRQGEAMDIARIMDKCPIQVAEARWNDPHWKANVLLQAHFSRLSLPSALEADQRQVIRQAHTLVQAIVDVIASHGWLSPALAAMEFSQMLVQAQWDYESPLKQLPYFTAKVLEKAKGMEIESVFDLIDDDQKRTELLNGMTKTQVSAIAAAVNCYPNVELDFELSPESTGAGDSVSLVAQLKRDQAGSVNVSAPFFPGSKDEAWWLLVGSPADRTLLGIKRVTPKIGAPITPVSIEFTAPQASGSLKVYLISDCWLGCDQEFDTSITIN